MLSGFANAVIIFLISGSLFTDIKLIYLLYFFCLAVGLYLLGRKVVQTKLTELTFDIVYDMRMNLIEKIFYTSYQKFEKMDRGRVFATLNDDTGQVGNSANIFVTLLTSMITTVGVFLYLSTIAFWATLVTLGVIIVIATIYYIVSQKAQVYLEEARDTRDVYMRLLNGLIDGFKELSIHFNKKKQYNDDVEKSTQEFRDKSSIGIVKFINAFMVGESMLVILLGSVAFAVRRLFPEIQIFTLMSFIMALLYLIGPVNGILGSIPAIVQLRIAWNRVKGFIKDIPANMTPEDIESLKLNIPRVDRIEAKGVVFQYESEEDDKPFGLGPIDFEAKKGEAVFIVGGNGSGKTTFAKILTGLYVADEGSIKVDGEEVNSYQMGEYFSTVFSGYHLFEKLYNIDLSDEEKRKEGEKYIEMLNLQDKVSLEEDSFSTIDLSGGQRKRLALLQCYLEDCPIYLFDEVAADQDPEFRRFFYRELLTRMKEKGKIVIAITHDDHYFDVADKVIKFDMGKLDVLTEGTQYMLSAARQDTVS
jgi:cyclic peptide transporter